MSTVYCIAVVPAASRDAAETALAPYLRTPTAPGHYLFSVHLSADGTGAPTFYGTCAAMYETDAIFAALPALAAAFPGSSYQTIAWRSFDLGTNWTNWLSGLGLRVIVPPKPSSMSAQ